MGDNAGDRLSAFGSEKQRMNRASSWIVIASLILSDFGCSKAPPTSAVTQVVETATSSSDALQSASQRLKAVKWVGLSKDGARQTLKFDNDGMVLVSENHPQRGLINRSYVYRIVEEDGERLTLHFADKAGTSVSGIHLTVSRGLDFSPGGAFEMSGHYDPE